MNKQQRTMLLIFAVVVVVLVIAIAAVNLSRRPSLPDVLAEQPSAEPTVDLPELHGKTEEEIGAMALEEEKGDQYVTAFDDDDPVETLDPNATAEPID